MDNGIDGQTFVHTIDISMILFEMILSERLWLYKIIFVATIFKVEKRYTGYNLYNEVYFPRDVIGC